jgi:hypothetical protein
MIGKLLFRRTPDVTPTTARSSGMSQVRQIIPVHGMHAKSQQPVFEMLQQANAHADESRTAGKLGLERSADRAAEAFGPPDLGSCYASISRTECRSIQIGRI